MYMPKIDLTAPLIRKAGKLVETTWEEAYNFIAEKLSHIKTTFGPEAITAFAPAALRMK